MDNIVVRAGLVFWNTLFPEEVQKEQGYHVQNIQSKESSYLSDLESSCGISGAGAHYFSLGEAAQKEEQYDLASSYFQKAASFGSKEAPAALYLPGRYLHTDDPEQNRDSALQCFQAASKLGDLKATRWLAEMHWGEKDFQIAADYLLKLAHKNRTHQEAGITSEWHLLNDNSMIY